MAVDVESLRQANPLRETVERLTGQQVVRHKISAPWRDERTPSLHIYEDGRWKDYGSGESGDVIDFVGRYYFGASYDPSTHFQEVVDRLGGLDIAPIPAPAKADVVQRPQPKPSLSVSLDAIKRWHETMPDSRREYWYSRGIMDPAINDFLLGWDGKRYTIPHLYRGVPFGVKRRISEISDGIDAKYIAIKGSRSGIFNLGVASTHSTVIICEGEIDAMLLTQYGFPACSGTTGAGTFKPEWARFFATTRRVVLLFDNDEAGRQGALTIKRNVLRRAEIVRLPEGIKDVGELIEKHDFPVSWMEEHLR